MYKSILNKILVIVCITIVISSCTGPALVQKSADKTVPASYYGSQDTVNSGTTKWNKFFDDPYLMALIDTALQNNQELNITLQEIEIARNEVRARKGEYLPSIGLRGGAEAEKVGRYTRHGAVEKSLEIEPGKEFPEPLSDFMVGAFANWEVDVWNKLRNARKSAYNRYLSSTEAKNFMVTNLVAEISNSYYELLALDNQLAILKQNIEIQSNALEIVKLQKSAAKATELAVRKFEAEVLKNRSRQYYIMQEIIETENRINFLIGRFPQPIARNAEAFPNLVSDTVYAGLPAQLLENRPDIRQAELELAAADLDIKVARANFYPSLGLSAGIGLQAFNPALLISPESVAYKLAGELAAPLINRNAIKASYYSANSMQIQAVYNYERTILNAYIEVANQLAKINNLEKSYDLKDKEVQALTKSTEIAGDLFRSARADYMEVLLTQRDVLEAKFELIETKKEQLNAMVNVYRALGGGWK